MTGETRPRRGRPPGSRNKRTLDQIKRIEESGQTPLDYLVSVYQDENMTETRRIEAAKAAAPFVHPRLTTSEVDLSTSSGRGPLTVEEMSDEELADLIRLETIRIEDEDQAA